MKKFFVTLLASIMAFSAFSFIGCGEKPAPESNQIVLADFEKFEPDFQLTRISRYFGAVNVNKDKTYVKSGETSAKVQPLGHVPGQSQPWMYFPLSSTRFEYDYRDFSYFDSVSMWVYNTESETVEVELGFVEKMTDINDIATVPGEIQQVAPGWNKLVYYPDLNALNLVCDVTDFLGVYLRFPHTPSYELEDAPVFYIDDVVLKKSAEKQEVVELIQLDEGEVLNFDKDWQQNVLIVNIPNDVSAPDVEIVKAADENLSLLDEDRDEYVLKVVTKASNASGWPWPGIEIPSKVIKKSGLADIPKADRSKYTFCFDVYAKDANKYFYPDYGVTMWNNWHATNHEAKAGKWTTYRYNLSLIPSGIYGDLSGIRVSWPEYLEGGNMTFYFDNFRIEYIGE